VLVQCHGQKKDGGPCGKTVKAPETHCHLHKNSSPPIPKEVSVLVQCHGQKKDGGPCGKTVKAPETHCHLHKGKVPSPTQTPTQVPTQEPSN